MVTKKIKKLQTKIDSIKEKIKELGQIRPGSLSKQYNICGNMNCRCKDGKNPKKHGPYFKLSYKWRGKNKTVFIKDKDEAKIKNQIQNYKTLRNLINTWIDLSLEIIELQKREEKNGISIKR